MRAKPEMQPWVHTYESNIELRRSGIITRAFVLRLGSAAPTELILLLSVCTQGCISGCALIAPWALQEYRAYGTHNKEESNLLF